VVVFSLLVACAGRGSCGGCDPPVEHHPDRRTTPRSSNTPFASEPSEKALRAQLTSLVSASLGGGGANEAMDLNWPSGAYSELGQLFGHNRNADPENEKILASIGDELPRAIREVAAGGEIEIKIGNHADSEVSARQRAVMAMLQPAARRAMFWARLQRKGGQVAGHPAVVELENITLLDGRFRYMGPLIRSDGHDCARVVAGPPTSPAVATIRSGLAPGVIAKAGVPGPVLDLVWAPTGDEVVAVTPDGLHAWDPQWIAAPRALPMVSDWVYCAVGNAQEKRVSLGGILAFGGSGTYGTDPSAVFLGPDGAARILHRPTFSPYERGRLRHAVAATLSPSGALVIANGDGSVCRGTAPSCDERLRDAGGEPLVSIALSPDGLRLAGITASASLVFFSAAGNEQRALPLSSAARVVWSPDGRFVVVVGKAGMVGASVDAANANPAALASVKSEVRVVAFVASGSLVVGTERGTIAIARDLSEPVFTPLAELGEPVVAVAAHGAAGIAAAGASGSLAVVDLPTADRTAPAAGAPSAGPFVVRLHGDLLYLAGYTVSQVGDPPIPIAELRRRLIATPSAKLVLETLSPSLDPKADEALSEIARSTGATFEKRVLRMPKGG